MAKTNQSNNQNKPKEGLMNGNVDQTYEFDPKDKAYVHVRMSRIEKLTSGAEVEDPGSVRFQQFRPEVFEDQKLNKEKGLPSIWDMGETVRVVHDPSKESKENISAE